jgi:hypothetical protein
MLTADVLNYIEQSVLCWLATVDGEGWPNVSPKEVFAAYDEQYIVIADIASPGSVANVRQHPQVSVSFIDVFTQQGYKVRAMGRIVAPHEAEFAPMAAALAPRAEGAYTINHIICLVPKQVEVVMAPGYQYFPEISAAERREQTMAAYGVVPRRAPADSAFSDGGD